MFKKLGWLVGCIILVVGTITISSAKTFEDVSSSDWFSSYVDYVSDEGLMNGTSVNRFTPSGSVTRAQLAQILYNMAGNPVVDGTNKFSDVSAGKWYNKAIFWASDVGVMNGYGGGKFGPEDNITREQIAKVLHEYTRYLDIPLAGALDKFEDVSKVSNWAVEGLSWAVDKGLISGTSSKTLSPKMTATRAQLAAIIQRYCENVATDYEWAKNEDELPGEIIHKPDDMSSYSEDWKWLQEPELYQYKLTDDGYLVFKFLGAINEILPDEIAVRLDVFKGDEYISGENASYYRCYPGQEQRIGFPYGPGTYTLKIEQWIAGYYRTFFKTTIEVSQENYEKSLVASNTMSDYLSTNMLRMKADTICKGLKTDKEKANAIFDWMSKNLFYDGTRLDEVVWGYIPGYDRIIEKNGAICLDFAGFYSAMCRSQGIPCNVIMGWIYKGQPIIGGYHAWNEVLIDGKWYMVDTTYSIGDMGGGSSLGAVQKYFMAGDNILKNYTVDVKY